MSGRYENKTDVRALVETLAKALVDHEEDVDITEISGSYHTIYEIRVHDDDVGLILGRSGSNINALRTIVTAACKKAAIKYTIHVVTKTPRPAYNRV